MTNILNYCLLKTGAYIDHPFGPKPTVIKVSSKMFAIINSSSEISLKCDPYLAESLRQQYKDVKPGYHLSKKNWNTVRIDGDVPEKEILWMIDHSYDLVFNKLTKAEKGIYIKSKRLKKVTL